MQMGFRETIRTLVAYFTGEPDDVSAEIPEGLPIDLGALLRKQVDRLTEYQDESYAALYLDRVSRFLGRGDMTSDEVREIAGLLADRMAYQDLLWFAQLKFERVKESRRSRDRTANHKELYRFRADEVVSLLPAKAAGKVLLLLDRFKLAHKPIPLKLGSLSLWSYAWLKMLASLPRWRRLSIRYARENAWCERWLHMIDRCLVRQPDAVREVINTARLVQGHGEDYSLGLANWHRIIDGLAKPVFDRKMSLTSLGSALENAQRAAEADLSGAEVSAFIAVVAESAANTPAGLMKA